MAKLKTTTKIEGSLSIKEVGSTPLTLAGYAQFYTKADNILYAVMGDNSNKTIAFTDIATLSSLTSIGTIGTGIWQGTDIGVAHGGTGVSAFTQYLLLYAATTTSIGQIAIGTDGQVLTSGGAGVAPSFEDATGGGDVSKVGTPENSQIGVWTGDGTIEGAASLTYDGANLQLTGDIGSTGTKITKGWFTDLLVTNAIVGSITGNAATVTNATLTTALTVNTGTLTLTASGSNNSVLTIGAGAVGVSGSNTGDQSAGDFAHDSLASITGTAGQYNHPTDANMTVIGNTSGSNTGDNTVATALTGTPSITVANIVTTGTLDLGHADQNTLSGSGGVLSIQGVAIPSISSTNTLTNKRITPRVTTEASSATPTINTDNAYAHSITALATNITNMTTNLTGTPTNFQKLIIRFLDNGTGRTISWSTGFEDNGEALPATTTANKLLTVGFIYDTASSKWGCVAVASET